MPLDIVGALITRIEDQLDITVWDGEIPRQDVNGSTITLDPDTVVYSVEMEEVGLTRTWTTEDPYDDAGPITVYVFSTSRTAVMTALTDIEELLAKDWDQIDLQQGTNNGAYVIGLLLSSWTCVQEKGIRTRQNNMVYRGVLRYEADIHGAISTRP
jgi:hypothetical protein